MNFLNIDNKPEHFYFNNKKVTAFSFFNSKSSVPVTVAEKQKNVFDKFSLMINIYDVDMRHPIFMNTVMDKYESDVYIFFDIDCVPLNSDVYDYILSNVSDDTLFGVAQQDNGNGVGHDYAAPSCLSFTNNLYNFLNRPSFVERQRYLFDNSIYKIKDFLVQNKLDFKDDDSFYNNIIKYIPANRLLCDVAEELTYVAEEKNINIKLIYPTHSLNDIWKLNNGKYMFGNGTTYDNKFYHQFQIRNKNQIDSFIKKCDEILKNK